MENKKVMKFGNIHLNITPSGSKKSFRPLRGRLVDDQQQALVDALWQANTPTTKMNAINATCLYVEKEIRQ